MTSQTIDPPVARPDLSTDSKTKPDIGSVVFAAALWACLVVSCLFLLAVLGAILVEGLSRLDWALISEQPSRLRPETSGVQSAIFGTLWVMLGMLFLFIVGVAFVAIVITHRIVGPLFRIKRMAREVASGVVRPPAYGLRPGDELQDVFAVFSEMVTALRARTEDDLSAVRAGDAESLQKLKTTLEERLNR